ncbi:MAG: hypothetical protein L0H84_18965 [Pseudonocardia sp.]|nr:hypothetical protein [Pseudonocardia sp.]
MAGIGHYNYENVDLKVKAAWLAGAPGSANDPLPAKLKALAAAFDLSNVRLTANITALGAAWQGEAAEAAQAALRHAAQRAVAAQEANDRGHASVTDYGVSFEEMRRKVHYEDPHATWQPAPTPGAAVPGDPFSAQTDQFERLQRHRTADAAANAALRAHEQRTRELVDRFPTLDPAPVSPAKVGPPGGIGPVPDGGGSGGGPGAGPGSPGVVAPPPGGSGSGSRGSASSTGPGPSTGIGGSSGWVAPPQAVPQLDVGRSGPGPAGPHSPGARNAPAGPTNGGPFPPLPIGAGVIPPSGRSPSRVAPPAFGEGANRFGTEVPGRHSTGVIGGGRSPSLFAPGAPGDGRQFASRLPVIAEPEPAPPLRSAPPGTATGQPPTRSGTSMYPPMMGGAGAGAGSTTRATKYWTPTSEAFDVELPPHVDGVIGADPEDPR